MQYNPDHPMSMVMFDVSGLLDQLLWKSQEMTVSPSNVRAELLSVCHPLFDKLRKLNRDHFGNSHYITRAIDEYESGLRQLAALGNSQIIEDRRSGEGNCPYCGNKITNAPELLIVVCDKCDELFMPAKEKLCSFAGFGI